jgi:hypothetical protein
MGKGSTKTNDPSPNQKHQKTKMGLQMDKRINYGPKLPPITRNM